MKSRRYDLYGAAAGLGLPVVGTFVSAWVHLGSVAPGKLLEAHLSDPLLWMMDTAPIVLAALGAVIVRQHGDIARQHDEIVRLERARRDSFERTASEVFQAAQGLLGNVSSFTATTAETAASVRETTATMSQLSQTATAAALTAETVVGLAEDQGIDDGDDGGGEGQLGIGEERLYRRGDGHCQRAFEPGLQGTVFSSVDDDKVVLDSNS